MRPLTQFALGLVCALAVANASQAATFTVTTTADSGAGSLRQAILDTNANGGSETDTIAFAIAASGVQTIAPATELPFVNSPVLIDGYSQPGASPNTLTSSGDDAVLLICLDGGSRTFQGLVFGTGAVGSTVRGLALQRFRNGILIGSVTADAHARALVDPVGDRVTVTGNFIGTDATGSAARGNHIGVFVEGVGDSVIGADTPAGRNVISGNDVGVLIEQGATQNAVAGNNIGVAADGMTALGNVTGVYIQSSHETHVQGNVISGNTGAPEAAGIVIEGGSIGNWIDANYIGTTRDGTGSIPNGCGIRIAGDERGSPFDTTIGILENVISAARASAAGNVIANNLLDGVSVVDPRSLATRINYNTFRNNGGLAVDLGDDGPTPNDPGDIDTGANLLQNFPVLTAAQRNGAGEASVSGTLDSRALTEYLVRLHYTETCDPSGFGEGAFAEETTVTTDAAGHAAFSFSLTYLPEGYVTATATDPDGNASELSACAPLIDPSLSADLAIVKQGPPTAQPGANITWTITVTNEGTTPATGVTVTDNLPPSTTFVSAAPTQGSCSGTTTVTCLLGVLQAGASATITLTATAPPTPQPVVNTATLTSDQTETTPADNTSASTVLVAAAALAGVPLLDPLGIAAMTALLLALALTRLR